MQYSQNSGINDSELLLRENENRYIFLSQHKTMEKL